jgi:hypothetical protein
MSLEPGHNVDNLVTRPCQAVKTFVTLLTGSGTVVVAMLLPALGVIQGVSACSPLTTWNPINQKYQTRWHQQEKVVPVKPDYSQIL